MLMQALTTGSLRPFFTEAVTQLLWNFGAIFFKQFLGFEKNEIFFFSIFFFFFYSTQLEIFNHENY